MDKLLREIEDDITRIKTRLRYLDAIETELKTLAGSIGFNIKNDIIHQMVLDSYDMVVIDLASLCRGMLGQGGFFNQLNSHLKKLKRANLKKITAPTGQIHLTDPMTDQERKALERLVAGEARQRIKEGLDEAFERLFPPRPAKKQCWLEKIICTPTQPTPVEKVKQEDINHLKDRFEKLVKDVIRDRDAKRAHRYEKRKADEDVEKLSLGRLAEEFKKVEQIINDLRALTIGGHFIYNPPTHANPKTVAEDIADLMILGSHQLIVRHFGLEAAIKSGSSQILYQWQFREAFYLREWRKRLIKMLRLIQQKRNP